jgi:hypothetical protein
MWAPLSATTPLGTVVIDTEYPFGDTATVTVTPATAGAPVPVLLRIPSWAAAGSVSIDGAAPVSLAGLNGTFFNTTTRAGGGASVFVLDFAPTIRLEPRVGGAVSVLRGALLYAVWIGQAITVTGTHPYSSRDLSVLSTAPWNVALVVDRADPAAALTFERVGPPASPLPFNSTAPPVLIRGRARPVPGWGTDKNAPTAPPASPACAAAGTCGDAIDVVLVPFGATHVRMAVLPTA